MNNRVQTSKPLTWAKLQKTDYKGFDWVTVAKVLTAIAILAIIALDMHTNSVWLEEQQQTCNERGC